MSTIPPKTAQKPATRRLPREERREAILEGATRAFAQSGFAATSMEEVAAAAGITPLIVYRHFASKEELYRAVLERVAERLGRFIEAEPERARERRGLGIGAQAVLEAARLDPDGFRLLWRHAAREPLFESYASELRKRAVAAIERAIAQRFPDAALPWAAHAVIGYLIESVLVWLEFGDPARDARFVRATNAAMKAGVRAWSEPG